MFHFSFFFFVFFSLHQDEPDEAVNRGSICSRISLQHLYKVFGHHLLHMHSHTYEGRMKKVLCAAAASSSSSSSLLKMLVFLISWCIASAFTTR